MLCLLALLAGAASTGCPGDKDGKKEAKKNVAGACECAVKCGETTTVDDHQALMDCKRGCQQQFGAAAMTQGMTRAIEVRSKARESCAD